MLKYSGTTRVFYWRADKTIFTVFQSLDSYNS